MLTLVPTPIGNLSDLSPRALEALKSADAVYAEDTRRTLALLSHFGVRVPVLRYADHREADARRMVEQLKAGRKLALVSDGGTPVISDPGWRVVKAARDAGLPVQSIPGPCAAVAALAGSGLPGDCFIFLGFLPRSPGKRKKRLAEAAALGVSIVVYESPYRVRDLLGEAEEVLGPAARAAVVRELSKVFEEWAVGPLAEVRKRLEEKEPRGEYVAVFHPGGA